MTVVGVHRPLIGDPKELQKQGKLPVVTVRNEDVPAELRSKYMRTYDLLKLLSMCTITCAILFLLWQVNDSIVQMMYVAENRACNCSLKFSRNRNSNLETESVRDSFIDMSRTIANGKPEWSLPTQCARVPEVLRFDCHPEEGASELSCNDRGCCWKPPTMKDSPSNRVPLNMPYCYYPDRWSLYKYENFSQDGNEFSGFLKLVRPSFYENDIPLVKMEATTVKNSILRVKIFDPVNKRYEPPWPIRSDPQPFTGANSRNREEQLYKLETDNVRPGFKVSRVSDGTTLFNSINTGGFIFSDQFLQISTSLPSHNIYGIGEHRSRLKLNTNWQSFTLFAKDQPPTENANLYGAHPFYLVMEDSGKAHGVLFLNSNAMDVILQPLPAVTFRTIGGIFDVYILLGPTPADVISQYSDIVGKPFLPPYWSLGFHLCRYGYGSLEKTKEVWNRTRAAGIPFDTQWNDLDYMDRNNDFTYDRKEFKDLPKFIEEIHAAGMHYIPLIDAGVSGSEVNGTYLPYDEGVKRGIFVNDESGDPFKGKVWNNGSTVWPDFTNPSTRNYYYQMMMSLHERIGYDGAWIDMNEPSNFYNGREAGCTRNNLDYPKYMPNVVGGLLATKTLCMNAKHYLGPHYDLHNTYGTGHAIAANYALSKIRQKRPFVISRSTWVGHGRYAGHWSGDVYSSWHDMRMSIPEILSFNLFQVPMVGADICGFDGNTTVALCNRWMQLGAFYPFARNHNSIRTAEQDPVALGDLVVKSSRRALTIRYWLLPYLYTLFFRAHIFGDTVARPLFFEFPDDPETYDIDTQFLWGGSLLISPVLEEGAVTVNAYLPRGLWYNLYTKEALFSTGSYHTLDAPLDAIPLMIRGGSIIPAQKPGTTTTESRRNGFELVCTLDSDKHANGELFWDDGESLDTTVIKDYLWLRFRVSNNSLASRKLLPGPFKGATVTLARIQIIGLTEEVSKVSLNGNPVNFKYDNTRQCLSVSGLQLDMTERFILVWEDKKQQNLSE